MGSRDRMAGYAADAGGVRQAGTVPRGRLAALLDPESFVEIDSRVRSTGVVFGFEREAVDGDGVVAGYGTIDGRPVYVAAQDPDVHGGSIGRMHAAKIAKAIRLAIQARAPFIGMYDSGGARIEEGVLALDGMAEVMGALNAASGDIPLISAVLGPCPGGLAFAAAASDFVFMGGARAGIFMNGPAVVAASEGKNPDAASIGGAGVHASDTGLASFVCEDEEACADGIRRLLSFLPDSSDTQTGRYDDLDDANRTDAALDTIAAGMDDGYDVRAVVSSVMDTGSVLEVSAAYAAGLFTGFARLTGYNVGVIANADPWMDAAMAEKATRFIRLCDAFGIPMVTFTDAAGYKIGTAYEKSPMIRQGTAMLSAFASSSVPRIGVIVGKAYGTAYIAMNSKQTGADMVYAWPTAEIAVVGPDTAANIIYRKEIKESPYPASARADFTSRYADQIASPKVAAALGQVDEVIQPSATRPRLASALDMLVSAY
ncbi:MAG: methylmalonyl-CoA carboxyltransferase [Clostridia bacterium]|nr:methylmalonyl-CoA carboxyltransferase [Clostridia bacterium]